MKQIVTVNVSRLIEWQAFCTEKNPRQWLADECGVSKSYICQVFCGVVPGKIARLRIARATGIKTDELFPVFEAEKKSAG